MISRLDQKIRQMHEAMGQLDNPDLSALTPERIHTSRGYYCSADFSQGTTEIGLANMVTLLITNIACIKDHLKEWCSKNGKAFEGEGLIDSDKNVAIVHDLWNTDKHAALRRPPRSGHRPTLRGLSQSLSVSAGTAAGSVAMFSLDPRTGQMTTHTQGAGSVTLHISGQIVDEHGVLLGDFAEICERAAEAWEGALHRAGVAIPVRG